MLFKDKKRKLLAGLDLNDRQSQISYIYTDRDEPQTISSVSGQEQYNVPTVLCKRNEVNQWFYGREAVAQAQAGDGVLVEHILEHCYNGREMEVDGQEFDPLELLALFVRRMVARLQSLTDGDKPDAMMITVEELDNRMIEVLNALADKLGLESDKVFFQSHLESMYHFVIHQPEDIRRQQVVICDYGSECMKSYRLEMNRKTTPVVCYVEDKVYRDMPVGRIPEEEPYRDRACTRLDEQFTKVVNEICEGRIISTVYLIGEGFLGNWCRESLKILCRNRRVFQGNNLYSKGACYCLAERCVPTELSSGYVFLGRDKVKANVGMYFYRNGAEEYYPVIDAGVNWFEARHEWDILLEDENRIHFLVTPLNKRNKREFIMTLEGLPERAGGFSRIHLTVQFMSESRIGITAVDMGFGEFFDSNHTEWKEEIAWEE